jgi:hypothetical protein
MTETEKLDDCYLLIFACGSALELAELARSVEVICQHNNIENWQEFYDKLYLKIAYQAGIPDEYYIGTDILQRAIRTI